MNSINLLKLGEFLNPENYVVAFYQVPEKIELLDAAQMIIEETSLGGWTQVKHLDQVMLSKYSPRICKIDNINRLLCLAYPLELFDLRNIHQLLGMLGGNAFGIPVLRGLILKDIDIPKKLWKEYHGSSNGLLGIRDYLNIQNSPILSTIIKPKVGLSPREFAKISYDSWVGGCDIVLDDDALTSQNSCTFEDRVIMVNESKKKAEKETNSKKMYFPNVSGSILEIDEKLALLNKLKINSLMVDLLSVGFVELEYIRGKYPKKIIHAHRASRIGFSGIESPVIIKIARLLGADSLHTEFSLSSVNSLNQKASIIDGLMRKPLYDLSSIFPFISGGIYPGAIPYILRVLGNDIIINLGSGIHGHNEGTMAGAKACKQVLDIVAQGKDVNEEYRKYKELASAIDQWGLYEYGKSNPNTYFVNVLIKN